MRKLQFKSRHADNVGRAAQSVGLQGQISTRAVKKPRRTEHRTVFEGTDSDVAILKVALSAHADEIGLDESPVPIGGWPRRLP